VPHRSSYPDVVITTDGSSTGRVGAGGWSAILVFGTHEKELSGYFEDGVTNIRMELYACLQGLKALKRACKVRIVSDSEYVVKGVNTWCHQWEARGWRTNTKKDVVHRDLWEEIIEMKKFHTIEAVWERGHNGHAMNERADIIARTARENGQKNANSAVA
jgi:ribonuclease HI